MTTISPQELYKYQEGHDYFKAGRNETELKKPQFTIVIPPPNITGKLHLGHAFTMTMQDIVIRYKRMRGFDCLLLPGTDHAAIACQMIVEKQLEARGIYRRQIGRVAFLDEIWKWKETCSNNITSQLRLLGYSADWSRERFTMDDGMSNAVKEAFVRLYNEGLIYKAKRLVNWDPVMLTTVSDLEVNNIETNGNMWYIKYKVEDMDTYLTIATTRPETMLGDTAVAINPNDERYNKLIGHNIVLPITGRHIPIVGDEYADMEKGTGAVKITPAHDFNDFEVGSRHNLPIINILTPDGKIDISELADTEKDEFVKSLDGMPKNEARKKIIEKLTEMNLFERSEQIRHQVPHNDRGGAVIEPRLTEQWFLNVSEMAKKSIALVKSGELKFIPKTWENTFFSWLENIQPWCISRQLWWGHQIPAYYTPDNKIIVAKSLEEAQKIAGDGVKLTQDEDTLDTWFSSGLWPMSTLGWPNTDAPDFKRYFPTSTLITGFDIIFFWVARMVMFSVHFTGKAPFDTVVCHGLVRDEKGQKMSKTKGNVIDPIDLIDTFGIDAVRWTICTLSGQGRDMNFGTKSVETGRKFITKLENAINFWEQNKMSEASDFDASKSISYTNWIIAQMNKAITDAMNALENYRFDEYAATIYHFVWDCFCDNFIELSKSELNGENKQIILSTAKLVIKNILKMLQPVIPFTTANLWEKLNFGVATEFMFEKYADITPIDTNSTADVDWLIRLISTIRSIRAENKISYNTQLNIAFSDIPENRKSYIPMIEAHTKSQYFEPTPTEMEKMLTSVIDESTTLLIAIKDENVNANTIAKAKAELESVEARIQSLKVQIERMEGHAPEQVVNDRRESLNTCLEKQKKLKELIGE